MTRKIEDFNVGDSVILLSGRTGTVVSVVKPKYIQVRLSSNNRILAFELGDVIEHVKVKDGKC